MRSTCTMTLIYKCSKVRNTESSLKCGDFLACSFSLSDLLSRTFARSPELRVHVVVVAAANNFLCLYLSSSMIVNRMKKREKTSRSFDLRRCLQENKEKVSRGRSRTQLVEDRRQDDYKLHRGVSSTGRDSERKTVLDDLLLVFYGSSGLRTYVLSNDSNRSLSGAKMQTKRIRRNGEHRS